MASKARWGAGFGLRAFGFGLFLVLARLGLARAGFLDRSELLEPALGPVTQTIAALG
jgi:hypothetical protein